MRRKSSARFGGLQPEVVMMLLLAREVYEDRNEVLVFTDLVGPRGKGFSYHPSGYAVDIRLPTEYVDIVDFVHELQVAVGPECDVVLEKDHIHLEFEVRRFGYETQ